MRLSILASRRPSTPCRPGRGVVRLPAGTFEISEPLRVTRGDVLLEGAGTATHIKNVNTEGEPAIVVRPAKLAADPKAMLWRVKLADLRVTGNPKSGHGIQADQRQRVLPGRRDRQ